MVLHARPHLETHNRKAGHSAIAGVAYRLGLRLYDRRTGEWHDYRRRKLGEEVVRALTVAPEGAPAWASDPTELWARVEAAEKRKDAQVARDYRIPIPFGLTVEQAGDLAEEVAHFICQELHTSVSMGLHRDADIDALGQVKPHDKQGFHAHVYFPTRRLEEIQDGDGSSDWGLGAKLVFLSNKNSSGAFVERLNEKWAELANRYTASLGLPADYDHRSYERMDLPIVPQPTLGAAVTAMERRGFFTRRGDALRGDIMVPAKVYEAAHTIVLDAQRQRAQEDVERESRASATADRVPQEVVSPAQTGQDDGPALASSQAQSAANTPAEVPEATRPPEKDREVQDIPMATTAMRMALPLGEEGSLLRRFRYAVPTPTALVAFELFARVVRWVQEIEQVLGDLVRLGQRLVHHREDRARAVSAKLDNDYQLDQFRARRSKAKRRLDAWEIEHPWKIKVAKMTGGGGDSGKPAPWQALRDDMDKQHRHVQELKHMRSQHQIHIDRLEEEGETLNDEVSHQQDKLDCAVGSIQAMDMGMAKALVAVTTPEERPWVVLLPPTRNLPEITEAAPEVVEQEHTKAELRPPARRMSP